MFVRGSGGSQRHQGLLWHIRSSSLEQLVARMANVKVEAAMTSVVRSLVMKAVMAMAVLLQWVFEKEATVVVARATAEMEAETAAKVMEVESASAVKMEAADVLAVLMALLADSKVAVRVAAAALMAHRCDKSTPCSELQSVGAGLL